jgi:hypothetical protein
MGASPSRVLRRAGTGLPIVNDVGSKGSNEAVMSYGIGSIVPALAKDARTEHPQFWHRKENGREMMGHPPLHTPAARGVKMHDFGGRLCF